MKTRTFRAVDGRKVRMNEKEQAEQEMVKLAALVMPVLTILAFALAAGVI